MKTIHHRDYDGIPVGIAVRRTIADTLTFRVRRGNGFYGSIQGARYQDRFAYTVPSSINNIQSSPYRTHWAAAVYKWKNGLTDEERKAYNDKATHRLQMSGFNLFMRLAMKGQIDMYVHRGDPAAYDFAVGDFTTDGTWRDLDLSAIIPTIATCILMEIEVTSPTAGKEFRFRKNGQTNAINHWDSEVTVGNQHQSAMAIVAVGTDRIVEYKIDSATYNTLNVVVRGWWT